MIQKEPKLAIAAGDISPTLSMGHKSFDNRLSGQREKEILKHLKAHETCLAEAGLPLT